VDALEEAIRSGKLAGLRGFGAKTEENLLHGIALMNKAGQRVRLDVAMGLAEEITAALAPVPGCQQVTCAGSLRRMRDTVGDIDILATAADSTQLMAAFGSLPIVAEVIASGNTKTSIRTTAGVQADLRVVPPQCWGAALQYFTGSKAHNIRTREIAVQPRAEMTRRIIHACGNPNVNIIGHPSTRLIGRRAPIDADWDAVFAACARTGTALEIDASPDRLDLPPDLIRSALRHGAVFAIDSDSHATPHLAHLRYGVATAQRGWLTPDKVINTWPLARLQEFLRTSGTPHR
jgi:hypothetical protein